MREMLLDILAPAEWRRYVEPFCGGAAVFFGAWARWGDERTYILNDRMECIVNFYRVAKAKPKKLLAMVDERLLYAKSQHALANTILKAQPDEYSDIYRAWAVWYSISTSYSKIMLGSFSRPTHLTAMDKPKMLAQRADVLRQSVVALQKALIEQLDAVNIIQRYDREGVAFFIDPPYVGAKQEFYSGYNQADFDDLLTALKNIKGVFAMTTYDNPALAKATEECGWRRIGHAVNCGVASSNHADGSRLEVITTNIPQTDEGLV